MTLKQRFPAGKLPDKFKHEPAKDSRPGRRQRLVAKGICPDCSGAVSVDTEAEVIIQDHEEREVRRWKTPVAFCSACEFAMEVS